MVRWAVNWAGMVVNDRDDSRTTVAPTMGAAATVVPPPMPTRVRILRTIEVLAGNVGEAVRDLTGGRGADNVFDTVGTPTTISQALECTRKGGTVVLTGLSRTDALASIRSAPFS